MKVIKKTVKPTNIFVVILVLLISTFSQSATAAMIGIETFFESNRNQETRNYCNHLIAREKIQKALVARGIDPHEAKARIDSLSDVEIKLISEKIDDLPAGAGVGGFVVVVGAVILALILIVEFTSEVKMFPQLQSSN